MLLKKWLIICKLSPIGKRTGSISSLTPSPKEKTTWIYQTCAVSFLDTTAVPETQKKMKNVIYILIPRFSTLGYMRASVKRMSRLRMWQLLFPLTSKGSKRSWKKDELFVSLLRDLISLDWNSSQNGWTKIQNEILLVWTINKYQRRSSELRKTGNPENPADFSSTEPTSAANFFFEKYGGPLQEIFKKSDDNARDCLVRGKNSTNSGPIYFDLSSQINSPKPIRIPR